MTQEQINELRKLAEAATPGPWAYDYDDQDHDTCVGILWGTNHYAIATIPYNGQVSDEKVTATGNYIAAANPAAVLELIDIYYGCKDALEAVVNQRQELLAALKDAREMVEDWGAYAPEYMQDKYDLQGDLDKLDAAITKAEKSR